MLLYIKLNIAKQESPAVWLKYNDPQLMPTSISEHNSHGWTCPLHLSLLSHICTVYSHIFYILGLNKLRQLQRPCMQGVCESQPRLLYSITYCGLPLRLCPCPAMLPWYYRFSADHVISDQSNECIGFT